MSERAIEEGFLLAESVADSDCIVVSTCTVIETTERKMLKRLSQLASLRKPMIVSGCMAELQRDKVLSVAPSSHLLPINDIESIASVLRDVGIRESGSKSLAGPQRTSVDVSVPIAQGCLGKCTYCITRLARGRLMSRSVGDILREFRNALGKGFKEIRLCAQDTASYGMDSSSSLADLLSSLSAEMGRFRIRVGMMNPDTLDGIEEDVIGAYSHEKVFKFLHLPVQSGSDTILGMMGRPYTVRTFERLVKRFRDAHPDSSLSTDIIVGFPGEGEKDFRESRSLVGRIKPDMMNITRFSPREGTLAYEMTNRIEGCEVKRRSRMLTRLRSEIGKENNERLIGTFQDVLLTEVIKEGTTVGRTISYKPVVFKRELPLGTFITAEVVGAEDAYLWGKAI